MCQWLGAKLRLPAAARAKRPLLRWWEEGAEQRSLSEAEAGEDGNGMSEGDSSVNVDTPGTCGLDSESEVGEMVIDVREIGCRVILTWCRITYWFYVLLEAALGPSGVIYDKQIVNGDWKDVTVSSSVGITVNQRPPSLVPGSLRPQIDLTAVMARMSVAIFLQKVPVTLLKSSTNSSHAVVVP
ncbi:hypothetical protein BGW80DRAFT_1447124 [Lactifluus volemus]|nr:hypothetical protein BGW80DRAFT_1447124 [Lactifluus volemus]